MKTNGVFIFFASSLSTENVFKVGKNTSFVITHKHRHNRFSNELLLNTDCEQFFNDCHAFKLRFIFFSSLLYCLLGQTSFSISYALGMGRNIFTFIQWKIYLSGIEFGAVHSYTERRVLAVENTFPFVSHISTGYTNVSLTNTFNGCHPPLKLFCSCNFVQFFLSPISIWCVFLFSFTSFVYYSSSR